MKMFESKRPNNGLSKNNSKDRSQGINKERNEGTLSEFTLEKRAKLLNYLKKQSGRSLSPPTIDFAELEGLPVFIGCVSEARSIKTKHGEREAVDIQILQDVGPLEEGTELTWWLTQAVVRSKIEAFKPLEGRRLCVICLGKRRGQRYEYVDYFIGTEAEGWKLLEETFGEES